MINQDKWVDSLPNKNIKLNEKTNQLDHYRWVNTIPKKETCNVVKKYSAARKYSLMAVLFVCGLLFVSAVKNETRNLEKEIDNLKASNSIIKFNLDQAILDNEVITSPENISKLATKYLDDDFITYKKSQISKFNKEPIKVVKVNKTDNTLQGKLKTGIIKEIEKKKSEIRSLQKLYSKPEEIPAEIKTQVAKKIEEKKIELKNLYKSPKEVFTLERTRSWAVVQVAKLLLGVPVIPGR